MIKTDVFDGWLRGLRDTRARARSTAQIRRLSLGNPGDVKPVGEGVSELRIPHGPGYRVYYITRGP
ncbi:type II toxin-antitoxin system RelE/ParE family toxin [Vreelandella rituensis]|uniref:type II toxin-antitoxin system RelE/ParE family toxin n=1 Tax=Vreelandella rituensis TaxID=2282306 RepID=UPI001F404960|nr:type II toxin-antitoxin system RelE/ParE family toxin [Halomonas rituensis]